MGSSHNFHDKVLGELSIDGDWPCQECQLPYWLLVGRTLLGRVGFLGQATWKTPSVVAGTTKINKASTTTTTTTTTSLPASRVWSLRAAVVCHSRLFMVDEPSRTLWHEIFTGFRNVLKHYCLSLTENDDSTTNQKEHQEAASVVLEWGLAQHHMKRPGKGRVSLLQALSYSGLTVELTGAISKRTKFQQVATAQLQVKASSRIENTNPAIKLRIHRIILLL